MHALLFSFVLLTACGDRPLDEAGIPREIGLDGTYPNAHLVNPGVIFGHRVLLDEPMTVQRLGVLVDGHGYGKMGLFASDPVTLMPKTRVAETGPFEMNAPRAEQALPAPLHVDAGTYWIGVIFEGSVRTLASKAPEHELFWQLSSYPEAMPVTLSADTALEFRYPLFLVAE